VQPGNLVKHKEESRLGLGLVTENLGAHCMVQWTYKFDDDRIFPGSTLEVNSMLEVISEGR